MGSPAAGGARPAREGGADACGGKQHALERTPKAGKFVHGGDGNPVPYFGRPAQREPQAAQERTEREKIYLGTMIWSRQHRFVFIKTAKTAGTSVEVFLSKACVPGDVVTPILPPEEGHTPRNHAGRWSLGPELKEGTCGRLGNPLAAWRRTAADWAKGTRYYNHMPAPLARCRMGEAAWDGAYKFCIERNPWDKCLSYYHMLRHRGEKDLTLDQFIGRGDFPINFPLYTDAKGGVMVDRILRYEQLDQDLGEVCTHVGIAWPGTLHAQAKSGYRTDRRSYRDVLSVAQGGRIARAFAQEIALLGYEW